MNAERRILQERVQPCALKWRWIQPQEGRRCKQQIGQRADRQQALNAERARLEQVAPGAHPQRTCCAKAKRDKTPERHRAFMVPPGACDLVDHRLQRVRIVRHQRDREIRPGKGHDQRHERQDHHRETGISGQPRHPPLARQAEHALRQRRCQRQEGRKMAEFDHPATSSGFSSRGW